jgi:hypothetical protein
MSEVSIKTFRPGVVHIDNFAGADPTGATDSTSAFQSAVDHLAGTVGQIGSDSKGVGGKVLLGAGHYLIAGAHINDAGANYNITIEGEGPWATTVENDDTSGGHTIDVSGESTSLMQSFRCVGIAFLGNSTSGAGLRIASAVRRLSVENCWFEDHAGGGIRVSNTVDNLVVRDCVMRAQDSATFNSLSSGTSKDRFIGIDMTGTGAKERVLIDNCEIQGMFRGIGIGARSRGITVRDCRIRDCVQGVKVLGETGNYAEALAVSIHSNHFDNNGYHVEVDNKGGGSTFTERARGVSVSNNYFSEANNLDETYAKGSELDDSGNAGHIVVRRTRGFQIYGNMFAETQATGTVADYLIRIASEAQRGWIMGNTSDSTTGNSKEVSVDVGATTVFGQVASFELSPASRLTA